MRKHMLIAFGTGLGLLILILDSKTAAAGAAEGIQQCINAVIPTLFPFFVLSNILTASIMGFQIPILYPLGRILKIPRGCESLFLIGIVGGYPVGSQCISQAFEEGVLSSEDASRMMGFCNNAGPAFLFGMGLKLFGNLKILFCLWGIHLLSAVITGVLLPGKIVPGFSRISPRKISVTQAVRQSIIILSTVCGWVVLFRILLFFLSKWCLWLFPPTVKAIVCGVMELANGFFELENVSVPGLRFLLCSVFIGFGGMCVSMQTYTVVNRKIRMHMYLPGKIIQCSVSLLLSGIVQECLFHAQDRAAFTPVFWGIPLLIILATLFCLYRAQNRSRNSVLVGV